VLAETVATEFCLSLVRAWAQLSRRLDSALGSYHGINFAEYQLLLELLRAPGGRLRPSQLAPRLELTASGVSRSLLSLEKIGLVTRQNDPRDARVADAHISSSGGELVENATLVIDDVINAYVFANQTDV
jgi:DNA-binding MarR family transcriptional regulator